MPKKAARILALVAFVALFNPGRNFLSLLDLACGLATKWRFSPLRCLHGFFLLYGCRTLAFWSSFVLAALLDFLLVRALYRYLAVRDFQKVCSDCAARPVRAWTLFALFAAFSFLQVRVGVSTLDVSIPGDGHVPAGFEPGEGPSGPVYFVQEGDTFDGLAVLFGIPADRLREHNGLAPDATLEPGQMLFLPSSSPSSGITADPALPAAPETAD